MKYWSLYWTLYVQREIRKDRYVLIIATNGEHRFTDMTEGMKIVDELKDCGRAVTLGKSDFHVLFNDKKAFDFEEGRFFVGSMLILKICGNELLPFLDEDLVEVKELLDGRMMTLVSGDQYFSALVIS